jgi:DNA-binding response OmpR family regulator
VLTCDVGPPRGAKVLLIGDNDGLAFAIRCALESDGHHVHAAAAGEVVARLAADRFDLVLLDAGAPAARTRDLLRAVRARGGGARVLLLGEPHASEPGRAGAEEAYLPHAYGVRELLARVHAALARPASSVRGTFR